MTYQRILDVTDSPEQMDAVRALFREYAKEIGIDLGFQGFEKELAELPGCYAAPDGCILLAVNDDEPIGCIALRPLEDRIAELKRMYVRPDFRGKGFATALARDVLSLAFELGYARVRLDTLESMASARRLYESLGFEQIEAYYDNPLPNVVYYERDFMGYAREIIANNLDEIGRGPWAIVIHDDEETTMEFVHMILSMKLGLSPKVAAAVMELAHLHGSAIARRFQDKHEAEALYAVTEGFIIRSDFPLRIALTELTEAATRG